ncbi:MAG: efflux RND transporter periplasmic adaptor subunit [Xanthomonadaceae bacterium]|nr:efflux RND transporter periplasmic adaptor subunit [Xanthomonadaceae bacterium]MDE3072673.1 efflux RND transporter periplasmic adaptor subunit [Pseudomonadota bacterium]
MKIGLHCLVLPFAVAALAACSGGKPPAKTGAAPALASLVVHAEPARREQVWDGVVEAVNQVTLAAQTNARVLALPYDVNDTVPAGAVLVRFTDVEQKSARSTAQAQIASAQAAYAEALASYRRFAAIYAKGYVATAQLDQQRARRDAALAALQSARAQLAQAGQQLDYTVLRAPYAGVVTRRFVHVGQAVQAGPPAPQPLIALESLDRLRVDVRVPQSAVGAIRRFHAADVLPADAGGRRIPAGEVSVFPYADPATHTFDVRLQLPGDQTGLYPGMTVKVAFATGQARRLLVPASALVQRGEILGVYVLGRHGVMLRQLRTGYRYGDRVEVLAGLDDGERIATDPVAALKYLDEQHAAGASAHD